MHTADQVRSVLNYDPETGVLRRRVRTSSAAPAGSVAGCQHSNGYFRVSVFNKLYSAHRLAWLITHGAWPTGHIDHINGDRADNRLCNLRDVTRAENQQNFRRSHRDSLHGVLGVTSERGRWKAQIKFAGKHHFLGRFDTPEQAQSAYLAAKRQHHPGCTI